MSKIIPYINTVFLGLLLILVVGNNGGFAGAPATGAITVYGDLEVDSTLPQASGALYVNGRKAVASSSNGIALFTNTLNASTSITSLGDSRFINLTRTGVVALTGATTSVSAANICDNSVITRNQSVEFSSTTLPTASALAADCMTADGDWIDLIIRNISDTNSTVVAVADSSSTLLFGGHPAADVTSTAVIAQGNAALLRFVRTSASTNIVILQPYSAP